MGLSLLLLKELYWALPPWKESYSNKGTNAPINEKFLLEGKQLSQSVFCYILPEYNISLAPTAPNISNYTKLPCCPSRCVASSQLPGHVGILRQYARSVDGVQERTKWVCVRRGKAWYLWNLDSGVWRIVEMWGREIGTGSRGWGESRRRVRRCSRALVAVTSKLEMK